MDDTTTIPRPNYLPALAGVGILIAFQNLAIRSDTTPDPFLRPALSVTQAFRLPPEMQPADLTLETLAQPAEDFEDPGPEAAAPPAASSADFSGYESLETGFGGWEEPPAEEPEGDDEDLDPVASAIEANLDGAEAQPEEAAVEVVELPSVPDEEVAPDEAPPPPELHAPAPPVLQAPARSYTVRPGDTLFGIARRFEVPLERLRLANAHLADLNRLRPGMELALQPAEALEHRVIAGESLWSIARFYGVPVGELLTANQLEDPKIFVNQVLRISTASLDQAGLEAALQRVRNRGVGFLMPVSGRKTDHFGMRRHPILGRMIRHRGLDIAARGGTRIQAAQDGKVSFAGWLQGYGNLIEIRHKDGFSTRYGHCSKLLKRKGEAVARGDPVALVGRTGLATATHVHFEIRKRGVPMDPVKFL